MATKLSKAERRAQLLETAHALVRDRGTDALTLGALAEQAGVSKPLVYGHFATRAQLLAGLYKDIHDRQVAALAIALKSAPSRLEDAARLVADAHMDCYLGIGREWHAIAAALRGDPEMDAYQRRMIGVCTDLYHQALAPLSSLPSDAVRRRCVGVIGAAEALSDAMVHGSANRAEAADDLASLIIAWLSPQRDV